MRARARRDIDACMPLLARRMGLLLVLLSPAVLLSSAACSTPCKNDDATTAGVVGGARGVAPSRAATDGGGPAALVAQLGPAASPRPCTVAEVKQNSVPAGATWFRLKPTDDAVTKDTENWPCGYSCWYPRTAPKNASRHEGPLGIQQLPFCALTDAARGTNMSLVVEAWSDRNDLGDGTAGAVLLASSNVMQFTFDDHGFSESAAFCNFSAVENANGWVTLTAHATDPAWYAMAGLISWIGVVPNQQQQVTNVYFAANTSVGGLPSFAGDMLGDAYSVREFSPPSINLSYSQPGVRFVGIYGAYSKWYSPSFYAAVTKYHQGSWPRDLSTGRTFQPFAVITPWENGTLPQLPPGFGGPRLVTKPIPGDWRLALLSDRITVFNGGTVFVRAVNTDVANTNGPQFAPQVVPDPYDITVKFGCRILHVK